LDGPPLPFPLLACQDPFSVPDDRDEPNHFSFLGNASDFPFSRSILFRVFCPGVDIFYPCPPPDFFTLVSMKTAENPSFFFFLEVPWFLGLKKQLGPHKKRTFMSPPPKSVSEALFSGRPPLFSKTGIGNPPFFSPPSKTHTVFTNVPRWDPHFGLAFFLSQAAPPEAATPSGTSSSLSLPFFVSQFFLEGRSPPPFFPF